MFGGASVSSPVSLLVIYSPNLLLVVLCSDSESDDESVGIES